MAKYRVEYEKQGCIGAFACVAVFSDFWEVGEDGKAILLKSEEKNGKEYLEIDEKDLAKMMEAAEACPVNVIHIYDEKGKKLI